MAKHTFEEVFWGPSTDPLRGVKKLHENYQYGVSELEEILNFVNQRMMTEEYYASRLQELAAVRVKPTKKGEESPIERDETNSVLHQVLVTLRQEATIISSTHRHMHDTLSRTYSSLKRFLDEHRKLSQSRKDVIDSATKRYETLRTDAVQKRKEASQKWALARDADQKYKADIVASTDLKIGSMDVLVSFGDQEFTVVEFNNLVSNMERDVPKMDVKSIIGTYKSVVSGASVLKYLTTEGAKHRGSLQSIQSATAFLTALVSQNFLKSIALRNSNKLSVADQQYQWKKTSLDNEPAHTKTRRDAERSEMDYRNACNLAEDARATLETNCVEHMKTVQVALLERLTLARTVISSYIDSEQSCISPITQSVDRFSVLLEMFSAERQVQAMAERDRTGNARLAPVVYTPSTSKISVESRYVRHIAFGVGVEKLAERDGRKVPHVLRKGLKALLKGCKDGAGINGRTDELAAWTDASMYASSVQKLRLEINNAGKPVALKALTACTMNDVIGLIKLWLQQLPVSVCSGEIYEPLKLLYLSKSDEFAGMRSTSIKSLLTTLTPAHYNSLFALVSHWQKLLSDCGIGKDDPRVAELSQAMGHLVLRPKIETQVTAHDKHPLRFLRDLLTHETSEIFAPGMEKAGSSQSLQIEGEDLDADLDDDEEENKDDGEERIIMLDVVSPVDKRASVASIPASVADAFKSEPGHNSMQSNAAGSVAAPRESMTGSLVSAAKSDEDLFLEAEAEGLDLDFDEADLKDLELEVDQILADNPDLM
ncbi:hypothetical protein BC830DRAFT_1147069 [Chytriomyces sp. MP71]|nr:hypothetical protein BC830DRAFT_1147069 [Chytriomyces sp. MP71]